MPELCSSARVVCGAAASFGGHPAIGQNNSPKTSQCERQVWNGQRSLSLWGNSTESSLSLFLSLSLSLSLSFSVTPASTPQHLNSYDWKKEDFRQPILEGRCQNCLEMYCAWWKGRELDQEWSWQDQAFDLWCNFYRRLHTQYKALSVWETGLRWAKELFSAMKLSTELSLSLSLSLSLIPCNPSEYPTTPKTQTTRRKKTSGSPYWKDDLKPAWRCTLQFSQKTVLGDRRISAIKEAQWPIGYGVGLRIKQSSVRIRPWPLRWVLGQGSLLPLSQGEAFTLASISYLAILV